MTRSLLSPALEVTVHPGHGFAIGSIVDRATGEELLWHPPGTSFRNLVDTLDPSGDASGRQYDREILAGGWFAMFPTAGLPAGHGWMHGEAPRIEWQITDDETDSAVSCRVELPFSRLIVERTVRLRSSVVRVEMTARNPTDESVPITFGEHPCFPRALFAGGEIDLPRGSRVLTTSPVQAEAGFTRPDADSAWPEVAAAAGGFVDMSQIPAEPDGRHDHLSIEVPDGRLSLVGASRSVRLTWDAATLPHVLLWEHFLPQDSMWPGDVLGVEPVSARGRSMEDARLHGGLRMLDPGEVLNYWMELELVRDDLLSAT